MVQEKKNAFEKYVLSFKNLRTILRDEFCAHSSFTILLTLPQVFTGVRFAKIFILKHIELQYLMSHFDYLRELCVTNMLDL